MREEEDEEKGKNKMENVQLAEVYVDCKGLNVVDFGRHSSGSFNV